MGNNVHDKLFKWTFSQVEHARGEIELVLPPPLLERIDLASLAHCPGSFVDEALKERHSDLLFSASIAGRPGFVYVLCEHQSYVDPLMPFRLLRYMVRIWEQFLAEHPDATLLPAIVPVVLHHSERGWTAPTTLQELLDLDPEALAAVAEHVPHLRFLLDDISFQSDEALKSRVMISAFGRLVLWCLRNARSPERIVQNIGAWVDLLREARHAPNGAAALGMLWRYTFTVKKWDKPAEILSMLTEAVGKEEAEGLMTIEEYLLKRGHDQGLEQGQRSLLLKLLGVRFGALPSSVIAQVNAAGSAQLDIWAERVLTATTLADVLAEG